MSPNLEVSTGARLGRTAMSCKELRRAGVLARVESGELKLVDAAVMMGMSYRQSKRLPSAIERGERKGLTNPSAGRESNRRKPKKFRERVLRLVGKKYSGEEGERFGPTLASEHLASDDDVEVNAQTPAALDVGRRAMESSAKSAGCTASGESGKHMWASWCRWMEVSTTGWRSEGRVAALMNRVGRCQRRYAGPHGG